MYHDAGYTTCAINLECGETKENFEPTRPVDVGLNDGFKKLSKICSCHIAESDELEAICNATLDEGNELLGHTAYDT